MKKDKKAFNPTWNLISLCLASFSVVTGFGVILPFFPLFASDLLSEIKINDFFTIGIALQIGIMTSAFMFTRFLLAPTYGDLSDSVGRKPLILVGMIIYTGLMIGFGLAFDFFTMLLLRAFQGVASAAVWPVGEALIVDTSPKEKVGRNLGYYMMSMQAGMASGPFVGFFFYYLLHNIVKLSEMLSYRLTFICVGILGVLATVIVIILVSDPYTQSSQKSTKSLLISSIAGMAHRTIRSPQFIYTNLKTDDGYRTRNIYAVYIVAMINGFGFAMIFPIVTLFLNDYYGIDTGTIALMIGIVGLPALWGGPIGGYISDRIGRKITVWSSGTLVGLLFISLGIEMALIFLMILFTCQRFLFGIMQPSFRALQSDLVPEKVRGKEFGIVQAFANFGSTLGPIIGGWLYDVFYMNNFHFNGITYFGAGVTFILAGSLALFASNLLLFVVDQKKDKIILEVETDVIPGFP
ncbi:MAG: MFS transporter [Candidatus Hodarchaeota archaeon]